MGLDGKINDFFYVKYERKLQRNEMVFISINNLLFFFIFFFIKKSTKLKVKMVTDDDPFMGVTSRQSLPQLSNKE